MTSRSGKIRMVAAQTPPFRARMVVLSRVQDSDPVWAQMRAEVGLMDQIRDQVGDKVSNLDILRKMGVYTVRYDKDQRWYVHDVDAPAGVRYMAVEEVPNWWEAQDDMALDQLPTGNALVISLLPTVSMDSWRKSTWPDRPHP